MHRYRVDYYINDKIVASTYCDAFSRRDAYYDAMISDEYKKAIELAEKKCVNVMWDATRVTNSKTPNKDDMP